jgi:S-adenosylmethionine decarboxylase
MGKHFLLDLHGVDELLLCEMDEFKSFILPALEDCMAEVLEESFHKFPTPGGYTYLALLSTSHFSIHTWPEKNSAAVDMFSCGEIFSDLLIRDVIRYFSAKSYDLKMITR